MEDHMTKLSVTTKLINVLAIMGAAALIPAAALADAPQEINTAVAHAGLAAKAGTIDMVHMHLHHVLNCLVGPGGPGFDAAPGNPCANVGKGAIPDSADAAGKQKLESVAANVRTGIADADIAAAKKVATEAQTALK